MVNTALPKTLVIGGANLDVTGSCFARLIPGDSNPGVVKSSAGGVGRNIAENLARLGFDCSLISAVGNDVGQTFVRESCAGVGVNTEHLIEYPDLSTGTYLAINNQLGALLAAIADMKIIDQITPTVLAEKAAVIDHHAQIVFEANLSEASLQWLAQQYSEKPIYVDAVSATKAPRLKQILEHIDVLKVNRDEASSILGKQADDESLAQSLHESGVKQVLLSQGPQGAIVFNENGAIHKAAIKGNNASDTGAGDSLFAGFIAAQHLLDGLPDQLEFAIACATFTLNSRLSVNPELSVETLQENFLDHFKSGAWVR